MSVVLPKQTAAASLMQVPVMAFMTRYNYNNETGACETFTYGGCGGNGNNYKTQEDCEVNCQTQQDEDV